MLKRSLQVVVGSTLFFFLTTAAKQPAKTETPDVPQEPVVQTETDGATSTRYFYYASQIIPHISKQAKGGEDAFVASTNLLAVADGVGGWIRQGIDSGLFSKQLVHNLKVIFDKNEAQELKNVLVDSVGFNRQTGTSTCVLAKFDTSRPDYIKTTNLGDSGYSLIRPLGDGKFKQLFRSKEQQYSFNFPYQCGTNADPPYIAFDNEHKIQDDDIIVMASDGVYDNLYDDDVLYCFEPKPWEKHEAFDHLKVAKCLSQMAFRMGDIKGYRSPFAKNAQDLGMNYPNNGKADDIVVVVASIHQKARRQQAEQKTQTNAIDSDGMANADGIEELRAELKKQKDEKQTREDL